MKKLLLLLTAIFLLNICCFAQFGGGVIDGLPRDSVAFTFEVTDSLSYNTSSHFGKCAIDTAGSILWRIGGTNKPFFSAAPGVSRAIMTDTINTYPKNANDWFTLKLSQFPFNAIVSFSHKYQMASKHAGGIVEYSFDSAANWYNAMDSCNEKIGGQGENCILTTNFYSPTDTLFSGDRAFTGTSSGWQYSRIQFFTGLPMKVSGHSMNCLASHDVWIRFRFLSDTMTSALDGWIIDNIKLEGDKYEGSVESLSYNGLSLYPNPSFDGVVNFPKLEGETDFSIEIINAQGAKVVSTPYRRSLDLGGQAEGLYFYRVTNGEQYYSGSLLLK